MPAGGVLGGDWGKRRNGWGRVGMGSEWVYSTIGDYFDISSGLSKSSDQFGFGSPFISFKTIFYNTFIPDNVAEKVNSSEQEQEKCSVREGDVFFTRTSETMDELGMSCVALKDYPNATFNGFTKRLRPKYQVCLNSKFLAYYFRSSFFRANINSMAIMTTRASLNNGMINNLPLIVPPYMTQEVIGETLYSFDQKIELNNRIIANLESQAQAIFKSWFVDFEPFQDGEFEETELGLIPKGWSVVPFTEKVRVLGGGTPKTDIVDNWNGDIPFFTPKDAGSKTYTLKTEKTLSQKGLSSCNSGLYPENTVFVTARGTVGKIALAGKPMAMNQSCYALVGKNGISQFFVYHLTQNTVERLKGKASGAVFDAIVTRDFDSEMVVSPKENTIATFSSLVDPLYKQRLCLEKQNIALRTTRDTLLPKLMSGEIEVPVEG